jgi:hypothetical protein
MTKYMGATKPSLLTPRYTNAPNKPPNYGLIKLVIDHLCLENTMVTWKMALHICKCRIFHLLNRGEWPSNDYIVLELESLFRVDLVPDHSIRYIHFTSGLGFADCWSSIISWFPHKQGRLWFIRMTYAVQSLTLLMIVVGTRLRW